MQTCRLAVTVNDQAYQVEVPVHHTLLDVLRDHLGLTGTKEGCRMGDCGACVVLVEGEAVNACLVLAPEVNGCRVTTIEGLARPGELHPLQRAFVERGALQCGYCTPGMVLTAYHLLQQTAGRPVSEAEVRAALAGNLCRCTGYQKILETVMATLEQGGPA